MFHKKTKKVRCDEDTFFNFLKATVHHQSAKVPRPIPINRDLLH